MDYRNAVAPKKGKKHNDSKKNYQGKKGENSGEAKFREAQLKLQLLVEKHLNEKDASSSEDEADLEADNILGSVIRNYSQLGGRNEDLERTQNFLENVFHSGAAVCLICIATVKRNDQSSSELKEMSPPGKMLHHLPMVTPEWCNTFLGDDISLSSEDDCKMQSKALS